MLEKILESPLDCKEIKPVNPKGYQSWIFIGKTNAEAEAPIIWPPDAKSRLTGKDPDAGKDWRQEEKGMTEDEMVGWHHRLNGYEFEQAPEDGGRQGGLACYSPWGHKESDRTEQGNNNNKELSVFTFSIIFLVTSAVIIWSWCFIDSLPLIGLSCKQTSNSGLWNHFFCYWLLLSYLWSYI